jgi:pimeloyl-ACP methyl ester carboxylesterase
MPYTKNEGVQIYYETEGQGSPLVMLHGLTGNLNQWRNFGYTEELKKDFCLILIDARGHGNSDKPYIPTAYKSNLLESDVLAVLNVLKIKRANFLGYSLGAWIGFNACLDQIWPQMDKFVLGGFAPGFQKSTKQFLLWMKGVMEIGIKQGTLAALMEIEKISRPPLIPRKSDILALDPRGILALIESMLANMRPDEENMAEVDRRILMFAGESDPFYQGAKESTKRMLHATFYSLPGLSHSEALMRSNLILPQIKQFLMETNLES